jgi:hypothetical protein
MRFHITDGTRRTTVSLDDTLAAYLALALDTEPHTPGATAAISRYLSDKIVSRLGNLTVRRTSVNPGYSQAAIVAALEAIARHSLRQRYDDWLISR